MLANAALAYLTNLLNFLVTKCTSALTLQVRKHAARLWQSWRQHLHLAGMRSSSRVCSSCSS